MILTRMAVMENWLDVVSVNAYMIIFKGSIDTSVSAMAKGPLPSSEVIYADANSQDTKRPFVECSFWTSEGAPNMARRDPASERHLSPRTQHIPPGILNTGIHDPFVTHRLLLDAIILGSCGGSKSERTGLNEPKYLPDITGCPAHSRVTVRTAGRTA